jgi:hypothetical protein
MPTVMPQGENIRKAVKWISEQLEGDPHQARMPLIEQAVFRYDLSPVEAEFLINFFRKQPV